MRSIRLFATILISTVAACSAADSNDDGSGVGAKNDETTPDAATARSPSKGLVAVHEFSDDPIIGGSGFAAIASFGQLVDTRPAPGDCVTFGGSQEIPDQVSAGVIHVTGGREQLNLRPRGEPPNVQYTSAFGPRDLFDPGAKLTITAAGADVPAFTDSVVAPPALEGVEFPSSVSRSAGGTVRWTPGNTDSAVYVQMLEIGGLGHGRVTACGTVDTGSFELPLEELASFPAEDVELQVTLIRVNETIVVPGADWEVALIVGSAKGTAGHPITFKP